MNKATVTRLDIAQNFITKHPPEVYLSHLGILKYATRLQEPNGIYYSQTGGRLCFYDKNREQKNHREPLFVTLSKKQLITSTRRKAQSSVLLRLDFTDLSVLTSSLKLSLQLVSRSQFLTELRSQVLRASLFILTLLLLLRVHSSMM